MSTTVLRRSTRVTAAAPTSNGHVVEQLSTTKKRSRKSDALTATSTEAAIVQHGDTQPAAHDRGAMPPPPSTPNKRQRRSKADVKPPPISPSPSAIAVMLEARPAPSRNYSTGDIDDATPPPPDRPAEPHHTNATLVTPGGTQVQPDYSNFEYSSPSKTTGQPTWKASTLLKDACAHLVKVDPKLKPVIDKHHCRIFSPEGLAEEIDPFRSLTSGIMSQQVSGAAAKSIKNKFIALFPPESCPTGFPPPALVAKTSLPRLREAGLSQRKAEYIQGLAEKFATGELTVKMLMEGSDEEVMKALVAVRGLGAWSVEMFMCFGLKRMDILSVGDLGVERGMAAYVGRDVKKLKAKGGKHKYMSEKDMIEIAEPFRPYRSLFMWYMWRIEDVEVAALQDNTSLI